MQPRQLRPTSNAFKIRQSIIDRSPFQDSLVGIFGPPSLQPVLSEDQDDDSSSIHLLPGEILSAAGSSTAAPSHSATTTTTSPLHPSATVPSPALPVPSSHQATSPSLSFMSMPPTPKPSSAAPPPCPASNIDTQPLTQPIQPPSHPPSLPSGSARRGSSQSSKRFSQTTNKMPHLILVAPPLQKNPHLRMYPKTRVVIPCQGPSTIPGSEVSFHMTAHRGYTIDYPREFGHRHKKVIITSTRWLKWIVRAAETVGGFITNVPDQPGNVAALAMTSLQMKLENKTRLQRVGISLDSMYTPHLVTEVNQKKALEELLCYAAASNGQRNITGDLRGIVRENGETIWVCDQCHECLQRELPIEATNYLTLPQYTPLVRRGCEVEVTLHNTTSVTILTETFANSSKTEKLIIRIDPTYFEAPERSEGAPFNSIVQLFNELGQELPGQKALKRLEIHCSSDNGEVYSGLRAVFQCRSLETLIVSNIPSFLQGHDIPIRCRRLKVLELQGVNVRTGAAATNLEALMKKNPNLRYKMSA